MDSFYIIVSIIAFIVLIMILTLVGISTSTQIKYGTSFPPIVNICPDYWTYNKDISGCIIPKMNDVNSGSIYNKDGNIALNNGNTPGLKQLSSNGEFLGSSGWAIDFNDSEWNKGGVTSVCNQKVWSNTFSIMYDGTSNYNSC